jgi:LmbE family N-acetylglucosaminyl deacetylase
MNEPTPVLVVTPHPDDAEGGAGGTMAQWSAQGRKVVLVVCTNGDKGTSDRSIASVELAEIRQKEQRKAAEVLGIAEVVFLGYPDQGLEDSVELRESIVRQIRTHRPETVMTVDPNRRYIRHRDHHIAGRVTLDAVFPYARDHLAYPEHLREGLEPHKVRQVYLWGAEEPDAFLQITDDAFQKKREALYCHVSQVGQRTEEAEARARQRNADIGMKIGAPLAEQFKLIELWG